jgi:nitrite reductase/ring-hydroxylating ferredoxin subunit
MFIRAAKIDDIAKGGLVGVKIKDNEITLANYGGRIYAVQRRCSHMKAPLDKGTLNGYILTCPIHFAQFDITTGERLSGAVPLEKIDTRYTPTTNLITHEVKMEGNDILVDV